jgi:hypothetical protein
MMPQWSAYLFGACTVSDKTDSAAFIGAAAPGGPKDVLHNRL